MNATSYIGSMRICAKTKKSTCTIDVSVRSKDNETNSDVNTC